MLNTAPGSWPLARSLLAGALLLLGACSEPPPAATPTGSLRAEPASLDFGFAAAGAKVSKTIVLVNDAPNDVLVSGVKLVDDARGAFSIDQPQPTVVPVKGTATLSITYTAPATEGEDHAKVQLANNAPKTPTLELALLGRTQAAGCTDGVRNGHESDVDCGGECPSCATGKLCVQASDCALGLGCVNGACGSCTADTQCAQGALCRAGSCSGCREDADCPSGHTCEEGTCKACGTGAGRIDTKRDPLNCGKCGTVCPSALNAPAACLAGACGRGACTPGTFDIDGTATFGCEATCAGRTCKDKSGQTIELSALPLPEAGAHPLGTNSGSSFGSGVQTSAAYTNQGVLGESPAASLGPAKQQSATYKHLGGFSSALRQ